jgi:hypothetical protein
MSVMLAPFVSVVAMPAHVSYTHNPPPHIANGAVVVPIFIALVAAFNLHGFPSLHVQPSSLVVFSICSGVGLWYIAKLVCGFASAYKIQ